MGNASLTSVVDLGHPGVGEAVKLLHRVEELESRVAQSYYLDGRPVSGEGG